MDVKHAAARKSFQLAFRMFTNISIKTVKKIW